MATLLEAKHVQLLVSGAKKASIVKALVEGPIHESLPGSLLKTHPNCTLYLDEAAASELS